MEIMTSLSSTTTNHGANELKEKGVKVEIKHLYEKYDRDGSTYIESLAIDFKQRKDIQWWEEYVLCFVHHHDRRGNNIVKQSLRINSTPLKDVLKRIIPKYPGISFQTADVTLDIPLHCLYHHLSELRREADFAAVSSEKKTHINLLLDLIEKEFKHTLTVGKDLLEQGRITYDM